MIWIAFLMGAFLVIGLRGGGSGRRTPMLILIATAVTLGIAYLSFGGA